MSECDLQAWRKSYLVTGEERDLLVLGFASLRRILREVFSTFSSSSLNSKTSNFLVEEEEEEDDRVRRVMERVSETDSESEENQKCQFDKVLCVIIFIYAFVGFGEAMFVFRISFSFLSISTNGWTVPSSLHSLQSTSFHQIKFMA